MKSRAPILLGVAVVALVLGVAMLYRLRLARGDFFPVYSSLRADPLGTRALHDSLRSLRGDAVVRWTLPLERLPAQPVRTLILPGMTLHRWKHITAPELAALEDAVRSGSRLVIAFNGEPVADPAEEKKSDEKNADNKKEAKKENEKEEGEDDEVDPRIKFVDFTESWSVGVKQGAVSGTARRESSSPASLPAVLRWESEYYFNTVGSVWTAHYQRGTRDVMIERKLGRGSIILASDAYFLSNEALQRDRASALLLWILGSHSRVDFVESHLGVTTHPGVAALARRYGLAGAFFTLLLWAGLFVWRETSSFVPPEEEAKTVLLDYHPTAGLEALLRRAVRRTDLLRVCLNEWRTSARSADTTRVEADLRTVSGEVSPVDFYNRIVRLLRRR